MKTEKQQALSKLFSPPFDIMFKGTFQEVSATTHISRSLFIFPLIFYHIVLLSVVKLLCIIVVLCHGRLAVQRQRLINGSWLTSRARKNSEATCSTGKFSMHRCLISGICV
jgi:hypothetical protein